MCSRVLRFATVKLYCPYKLEAPENDAREWVCLPVKGDDPSKCSNECCDNDQAGDGLKELIHSGSVASRVTIVIGARRAITRIILLSVKDEEGRRLADDLDGFSGGYTVEREHDVNLNAKRSEVEESNNYLARLNARDSDVRKVLTSWLLEGDLE